MIAEKDIPPKTKEKIINLLARAEYSVFQVKFILSKLEEKKKIKKRKAVKS